MRWSHTRRARRGATPPQAGYDLVQSTRFGRPDGDERDPAADPLQGENEFDEDGDLETRIHPRYVYALTPDELERAARAARDPSYGSARRDARPPTWIVTTGGLTC